MKSLPELIAEHNAQSEQAERNYVELRDAISLELVKILETRRLMSSFELRLYDEITKFQKDLANRLEKFNSSPAK